MAACENREAPDPCLKRVVCVRVAEVCAALCVIWCLVSASFVSLMSGRLSGLREGKSVNVVSVGLSRLVAQVHLPPEDGAEGEHAMANGQLMIRERERC